MEISQVFGISGRKGHGKDTLAVAMTDMDCDFKIIHFADELKRISMEIFGLTHHQVHDPVFKEMSLAAPIYMDNYLPQLNMATGLTIQPRGLLAQTPRELLQYIGTDYVRSARDSYWIDCVREKILDLGGKKILIPDTRFPNEEIFLREMGAYVVKIVRTALLSQASSDAHTSETSIDSIQADYTIRVGEGDHTYIREVAQVLTKFQGADLAKHMSSWSRLCEIVRQFNLDLSQWSTAFEFGANFQFVYRTQGSKCLSITDLAPLPADRPKLGDPRISQYEKTLKEAGNDAARPRETHS